MANPLPQADALACVIIGKKARLGLAAQTALLGHPEHHRIDRVIVVIVPHRGLGGARDLHAQIDRGFVDQLQRPQRHAHQLGRILDQRRCHAFGEHANTLVHVRQDAAIGVEEARIMHDDGRLADLAHEVERLGHGPVARLGTADYLDQRHLVDGAEEMDADELLGAVAGLGQLPDGER